MHVYDNKRSLETRINEAFQNNRIVQINYINAINFYLTRLTKN